MKKYSAILLLAIFAATLLTVTSCIKTAEPEIDYTTDFSIQSDDQALASTEDDALTNDVNLVLESDSSFAARNTDVICDATIVATSTATAKTITITYNGTNCNTRRIRTGVAIITCPLNKKWEAVGASISMTFQDLKITRTRDNKSIVLNGTKTITNVSGGLLKKLASTGSVIHSISSNGLSITYEDSTKRAWDISKKRVFSYQNGIVIKTTGTRFDGTINNISEWGINRKGKEFSCQITQALVIRQDCSFRLVSGKVVYPNPDHPITITYGLNSSGIATGCPGSGNYYFKMEWRSVENMALSYILPY
ncbi:MAG: hypothetical protein JWQ40_3183 [Segetibacter sp.]|nr:hypothetical protein [Segetibacter sp.]